MECTRLAKYLLERHSFGALQETHGTEGRALGLTWNGVETLWSHHNAVHGGIALAVNHSFLKKFSNGTWTEVEEGRIGVLQLNGPFGALDVWVVYLHATSIEERNNSMQKISAMVRPRHQALTVLTGDFNFTEHLHDRWCKEKSAFTGDRQELNSQVMKAPQICSYVK